MDRLEVAIREVERLRIERFKAWEDHGDSDEYQAALKRYDEALEQRNKIALERPYVYMPRNKKGRKPKSEEE